jgi:ABC-type multidrug transport system ATPase subunit
MALSVRNLGLTVRIGDRERTLLERTSLQVEPGQVLGLMGPSGSGKTTLLRLVAGLERRSGGTVSVDGSEVEAKDLPGFRCTVSLVPQVFQPGEGTPDTFLEGVRRFGTRKRAWPDRSRFLSELAALGLAPDTLTQAWSRLSGGEQRRMLVALALAFQPAYLLLDEAAAGLDPASEGLLIERLQGARGQGAGILFVSHSELLLARLADRVAVFYDGRVQAEGGVEEVLAGALAELRRSQAR